MHESEVFAVAARLHVVLRRATGRVTDVQWMTGSREYALEVIRLARERPEPELLDLAAKFEAALAARQRARPSAAPVTAPANAPVDPNPRPSADALASRYVGRLR